MSDGDGAGRDVSVRWPEVAVAGDRVALSKGTVFINDQPQPVPPGTSPTLGPGPDDSAPAPAPTAEIVPSPEPPPTPAPVASP